jgi:DNA-binding transcriptional ArsR family regulator
MENHMNIDQDLNYLVSRVEQRVSSLASERINKIVREVLREVLLGGVSDSESSEPATRDEKLATSLENRNRVYQVVVQKKRVNSRKISDATGLNRDTVKYHLNVLRREGKVKMTGDRRQAYYHI